MGHYKKKEYKKRSFDSWLKRNMAYEIQETFDTFDMMDEPIDIIDAEPKITMVDRPLIVKKLREEEREGLLPTWMLDPNDDAWLDTFFIDLVIHTKQQNTTISPIQDYEKTYQEAKKISDLLF